jgi:hypothetical protein
MNRKLGIPDSHHFSPFSVKNTSVQTNGPLALDVECESFIDEAITTKNQAINQLPLSRTLSLLST